MTDNILGHYRAGRGFPLVLLHPVGLDHSFWGGLVEHCAASRQVIAFDLPGHGLSAPPSRNGIAGYVDAIEASLQHLGLDQIDLLGLSFGGMISQELALRRPGLVRRLVLSACGGAIPSSAREAVAFRGTMALEHGMEAVLQTTLERWFTPDFMSQPIVARVGQRLLDDKPSNWSAAWHAISEHDALNRLPTLALQAMVIIGEKDLGTPVAAASALSDAIPNARLSVVENAPHMVQLECPEIFTALVSEFLA